MKVVCDLSVTSAPARARHSWHPGWLFRGGAQGAWYDPSDLSTLFQDTSGTVPVEADGDPVALIQDLSGNGNHAVQHVAPARPTWRTDGTLSWLEYDGADDRVVTPAISYSNPNLSICAGLQYFAAGSAWGSIKSAAGSIVYVGLSSPLSSGSISNCGGQTFVNGAVAPNDRMALRTALLNKSVISVRNAQSSQFATSSTFVAYSSTPPPAAILNGYIEIEGATPEEAIAEAELFDGKLALISNAPDLTPADAVARYKGLADIERGFRVLKSDIEIAPVHHRLPDRIRAHAMICFLALVLYRVMRMRLKAKGHSASPRTALDLLERIQRHTTSIGERTLDGLSTITPEQLELFDTLDLPKPA